MPASAKAKPLVINLDDLIQPHWTQQETDNASLVVNFFQTLMNEHDFDETLKQFGGSAYVQHNRSIPDGFEGVISYVKALVSRFPDYAFDVKRIIAAKGFVVLHSHVTLKAAHRGNEAKGFIITDTFRIEDGRLAEHWDAIQPLDFFTRFLMLLTGGTIANKNPVF